MRNLLKAHQISFQYPQNNHGLHPTSLEVRPGELVLISGSSGCGKSTLARCLTGLIPHLYHGQLSGEVWLDGLQTNPTPLWKLAGRAGLVFQNPAGQMLAHSVEEEIIFGLENLGLDRTEIGQRLEETIAHFKLESFRDRAPQTLSGGEQQKLALAAITARRPAVLVLDEPLSMLDTTAATELVNHLEKLAQQGTAVLICEHRAEYLRHLPHLRQIQLNGHIPKPVSPTPLPIPATPAFQLTINQLTVQLGGRDILRKISFTAEGGQVLAIVGRNGAGKTTLLRTLAGLQKHDGDIAVNGERPDLGLVFQNADLQLFNATVRDEILHKIPEPDMALFDHLLPALGLSRYEETPPLLLSEGEKKRVALATVIMRRPRHGILLDEPALGQDSVHKEQLIQLAHNLAAAGQLVILTTHDLTLAQGADRLLLLSPEGMVADGSPVEVLQDTAAWQKLGLIVPPWLEV